MSDQGSRIPRVWDRFLTEQDKAHLALSADRRVGVGARPALLMVDLYRNAFGDRPVPLLEGVKIWPSYCGMAAWNAVPHIQKLLAEARRAGIPVLYVTGLSDAGMPNWGEAVHHDSGRSSLSSAPPARENWEHRYDIIPEVAPIEGEVVLKKSSPSGFWGTPLVGQLTHLGVDTILVAGESTSGCVRASVVDGCTYRFRMQVIEECVFDRHEACHAINLFDMHQKYADVISLNDVVKYLRCLSRSSTVPSNK